MKFARVTLRQQIQEALKVDIRENYKPGDHLPGERVLAKKLGVSIVTLREALHGLVNEKLIERRQGKGTLVLGAESREELPIGILVDLDVIHPNTSPNQLRFAMEFKRELEKRGHEAVLFLGSLSPGSYVDNPTCREVRNALEERSIKALIVVTWTTPLWRMKFENAGIPVIRFGGDCPSVVSIDSSFFIESAVDDLLARGRKRLGLLSWEGVRGEYASIFSQAFRNCLKDKGLEVNEKRIVNGFDPNLNGAGWEAFREIWHSDAARPDGLLISDDLLLRGALVALHELQIKSPRQLLIASLTTQDNAIPGMRPSIQYEIPVRKVARLVADLTESKISDPKVERRIIVRPQRKKMEEGVGLSVSSVAINLVE